MGRGQHVLCLGVAELADEGGRVADPQPEHPLPGGGFVRAFVDVFQDESGGPGKPLVSGVLLVGELRAGQPMWSSVIRM
ncbi:hypothetical protein GCM10009540_90810 [Streptomyces turgidiscabies]